LIGLNNIKRVLLRGFLAFGYNRNISNAAERGVYSFLYLAQDREIQRSGTLPLKLNKLIISSSKCFSDCMTIKNMLLPFL
jgi:hypothetical protein